MKIMNLKKRTIIILLIIGIVAVLPGCVRYSGEHEPEPGEENYQLEITVEVAGTRTRGRELSIGNNRGSSRKY